MDPRSAGRHAGREFIQPALRERDQLRTERDHARKYAEAMYLVLSKLLVVKGLLQPPSWEEDNDEDAVGSSDGS